VTAASAAGATVAAVSQACRPSASLAGTARQWRGEDSTSRICTRVSCSPLAGTAGQGAGETAIEPPEG
jgi:hypothetical protein